MLMEIITALTILGHPSNSVLGPKSEVEIILIVATDYGLDDDQTRLLLALRPCENGKVGVEYGVGSDNPKHQARRYQNHPGMSLRTQARWAAGTIRKRYFGNLDHFMKRWNPSDPHEVENVRSRMNMVPSK